MNLHVDIGGSVVLNPLCVRFGDDLVVTLILVLNLQVPIDVGIDPLRRHLINKDGNS